MSQDRDILKSLLIKEELETLENLKKKYYSEQSFTEEVAKVLAGALRRAQSRDSQLDIVLTKPIQKGVTKAFSDNKQSIIDSLLPIMGQLIRKTVTNSIKQFVTDINRTLELGFSAKALKWRWQAYKTGTSFAEIVFQKTIRYQVNEIFIIDNETGLLVQHAGSDEFMKDKNAISAMLTAIKDFVGDSLQNSESGLLSAEIDDNQILISSGPKVYMAMVVKGSPTERFKQSNQELIEDIHSDFSEQLMNPDNFQNIDGLEDYLKDHLITKSISEEKKSINWIPWIIGIILLISSITYYKYHRKTEFDNALQISQNTPGFFLQTLQRSDDGFLATGLIDPDTDITRFSENNISIDARPYISLDPEIINNRIIHVLKDHPNVEYNYDNGNLYITGSVVNHYYKIVEEELNKVTGVQKVINNTQPDFSGEVSEFLSSQQDLQGLSYEIDLNELSFNGSTTEDLFHHLIDQLEVNYPMLSVKHEDVIITDSTDKLIQKISTTSLIPDNEFKVRTNDQENLNQLIQAINLIIARKPDVRIEIIGESDCQGQRSDHYSLVRANSIKHYFTQSGIDEKYLKTSVIQCDKFDYELNENKKRVKFKVLN